MISEGIPGSGVERKAVTLPVAGRSSHGAGVERSPTSSLVRARRCIEKRDERFMAIGSVRVTAGCRRMGRRSLDKSGHILVLFL